MVKRIIDSIAATRSRNEKVAILKSETENIVLHDVPMYCYDSFKHYYINKIPKAWIAEAGIATLEDLFVEWTLSLERLSTREIQVKELRILSRRL
jgi:hypothetical protein